MEIQKFCKTCEKEFTAIKTTQYFCSRKCFRKDYHHRKREEELNRPFKFPAFHCQECGRRSLLEFDPAKDMELFDAYRCPYCDYSVRYGWEHRHKTTEIRMTTFGTFSSTSLFSSTMTISVIMSST